MTQESLLDSNKKIKMSEEIRESKIDFDNRRKEAGKDGHNKLYCLDVIRKEEYLWDLRCWKKPKDQHSREEIRQQIKHWAKDEDWTSNCGHAVYCLKLLLDYKKATMDEIIDAFLDNNKIKYADEIGTW